MLFEPNDEKQKTVEAQGKDPQTWGSTAAKAPEQRQGIEAREKCGENGAVEGIVGGESRRGYPKRPRNPGRAFYRTACSTSECLKVSSAPATKKIVQYRGPELKEEPRRETVETS